MTENDNLPVETDETEFDQLSKTLKKIDVSQALKLRIRGWTLQEIGDRFDCSKQAVQVALKPFGNLIPHEKIREGFRDNEGAILTGAKLKLLKRITDDKNLEKTSVKDASLSYEKLDKSLNLKEGKATANVQHLTLTPELEKILRAEIDIETQKAIAEAHAEEALDDDEDY